MLGTFQYLGNVGLTDTSESPIGPGAQVMLIVDDLGILNYGGLTLPQMPSPRVLLGATGNLLECGVKVSSPHR